MIKTNSEPRREYRVRHRVEKSHKKPPKSYAERVRKCRARCKLLKNCLKLNQLHFRTNSITSRSECLSMASQDPESLAASSLSTGPKSLTVSSTYPEYIASHTNVTQRQEAKVNSKNVDVTLCNGVNQEFIQNESAELQAVDRQECDRVTSALKNEDNINADRSISIKVEPGDIDLDIGPTVFQHMDSYYKNIQLKNIVKQENTIAYDNHPLLSNKVNKETITNECDVNGQKYAQTILTPVGIGSVNAASDVMNRGICIKVKGTNLVIGPSVLLGMDTSTNQNTSVVKAENTIDPNNYHPRLQGEEDSVEGEYGISQGSQHRNDEIVSEQRKQYKSLSCDKCVQTFACNNSFREHYRWEHMTEFLERTIYMEQFPLEPNFRCRISYGGKLEYECLFCTKIYKLRKALRRHVEMCHRFRATDKQESNGCGEILSLHVHNDNSIYCNMCGELMTSKLHLRHHKKTVHSRQRLVSRVANRCDYCQKTYSSKYTLEVHVRVVHRKGFHNCSKCTAYFKSEDRLQNHMKLAHAK